MRELTNAERVLYGNDAQIHPITDMPLEQGHGALSHMAQALLHLVHIESTQGKEVADAMRAKLSESAAESKQPAQSAPPSEPAPDAPAPQLPSPAPDLDDDGAC